MISLGNGSHGDLRRKRGNQGKVSEGMIAEPQEGYQKLGLDKANDKMGLEVLKC